MPVSDEFVDYVIEQLSGWGDRTASRRLNSLETGRSLAMLRLQDGSTGISRM